MIKFFRKIRQKLLQQNRITQYLAYAIGEIFLVVIGILIALQINNWQENKKLRAIELETLTEIQQALVQDIKVLDNNLFLLEKKKQQAQELIDHIEEKQPHSKYFDRLMMEVYYHRGYKTFNTAAFELLKQRGFGIIQNNELRNKITNHFTTDHSDIYSILTRIENLNLLQAENVFRNFRISGKEPEQSIISAYDYDELLKDPRVFGPFYHFEVLIATYHSNLSSFRMKSEQTLNAVTAELEQRKN